MKNSGEAVATGKPVSPCHFPESVCLGSETPIEVSAIKHRLALLSAVYGQMPAQCVDIVPIATVAKFLTRRQEEIEHAITIALKYVTTSIRPFIHDSAAKEELVLDIANDYVFQASRHIGPTFFIWQHV